MTRNEPAERLWQARLAKKQVPRAAWASGADAYADQPRRPRQGSVSFAAGQRFGRLVITADRAAGSRKVRCRCDCGSERDYLCAALRSGGTRSCGCSRRSEPPQ